jgi:Flp pilus assembly protein TadD
MLGGVKLRLAIVGGLLAGMAKGKHSRSGYVALVFALHRGRHSGRLKITNGRRYRELFFIAGRPVIYRSDLPEEDLAHTIVYADLIPEDRVKWIADKLSEDEKLQDALIMSGSLSKEQLEHHLRSRTRPGISGPLTWSSGDWTFEALPASVSEGFDVSLLGEETALPSLWNGVSQHVGTDEVLPSVTDAKKGNLSIDDEGTAMLETLKLSEPFSKIREAIGSGASVEDIFRTIPDTTGGLFKLLWMLENGGAVQREHGTWKGTQGQALQNAVDIAGGVSKEPETDAESSSSTEAAEADGPGMDINAEIAAAHSERMGQDFYVFLGLDPASPRKEVDKACKGLAQRWRTADSSAGLSAESRRQLKDLLAGVQLAWRTLTDPKHKREYDRRLDMGRAPKVEIRVSRGPTRLPPKAKMPSASSEAETAGQGEETNAERGRVLLNNNQFAEAAKVLEEARLEKPSDPGVLADLGWARWKARQWGKDEDVPEEFLRLALTFEPQNTRALEFLARISIDKGESEKAQKILKRILKITPGSEWARAALLSQQKGQRSETVTRRGFWRGKGDKS